MPNPDREELLLSNLLEALDAVYDGWDRADRWLSWLLDSTAVALADSRWDQLLAAVSGSVHEILASEPSAEARNRAVLVATDDLRQAIAAAG